ncbi:hypothetical protein NDU88_000286 [Pleurodeles waltl]|uniref:Uncharacterized protein n=1 Tax=Pleurodeles waltl TaxID=8319 RepID=A0AAV7P0L6_PLEWA|nr:hypothetical protein NDU88_000286 [Pleurodeles waltl]
MCASDGPKRQETSGGRHYACVRPETLPREQCEQLLEELQLLGHALGSRPRVEPDMNTAAPAPPFRAAV